MSSRHGSIFAMMSLRGVFFVIMVVLGYDIDVGLSGSVLPCWVASLLLVFMVSIFRHFFSLFCVFVLTFSYQHFLVLIGLFSRTCACVHACVCVCGIYGLVRGLVVDCAWWILFVPWLASESSFCSLYHLFCCFFGVYPLFSCCHGDAVLVVVQLSSCAVSE